MLSRDVRWTLEELSAQVALALAVDYAWPASGRVREVPDTRTIRYYTTLGMIDRPAEMRGRTALYGMRHLLQVVAIKRLQAQGLSLAEIQGRLVGLTDAALRELAQVAVDGKPAARKREEGRPDFWKATPEPAARADGAEATGVRPLAGVPLADGVTLLLEAARPLDEHDGQALRAAAAPLLKLLEARRLVGEQEKRRDNSSEEKAMRVYIRTDELRDRAQKLQGKPLHTVKWDRAGRPSIGRPFRVEKVEEDSIYFDPARERRPGGHTRTIQEQICSAFNDTQSLERSVVEKAMEKRNGWYLAEDLALIVCILADRVRQGQALGLPGVSDEEVCRLADMVRGEGE